jgi:pimeloyl-ACP methyl ester carboxylesterase
MRMGLFLAALALLGAADRASAQDKPKRHTFDADGVKLAYFTQGKGEPVVLIHGWLSTAGINWALPGTSGHLAKDFEVLALDVRGHGLSDRPTRVDAYGTELVEDVVRLLDHRKIKKAHVVGYSMGGIIAANFLAKHPDRALSGTLCGSGWLREGGAEQKAFAAGGKDGKPAGLCFQSLAKLALTEKEIKSIEVPVCMIIGDKDGLKKLYVDPLRKVRKDWPVVEVPDGDHVTCILRPRFREEIATWLRKNPQKKEE